jgi:hypothetical protein
MRLSSGRCDVVVLYIHLPCLITNMHSNYHKGYNNPDCSDCWPLYFVKVCISTILRIDIYIIAQTYTNYYDTSSFDDSFIPYLLLTCPPRTERIQPSHNCLTVLLTRSTQRDLGPSAPRPIRSDTVRSDHIYPNSPIFIPYPPSSFFPFPLPILRRKTETTRHVA